MPKKMPMADLSQTTRRNLAKTLRSHLKNIALQMGDKYCETYPELEQSGDDGRKQCVADAEDRLTFLASAIEFGTPETFVHCLQWISNVLHSRNIPFQSTQDFSKLIPQALNNFLSPEEMELVLAFNCGEQDNTEQRIREGQRNNDSSLRDHQITFQHALLAGNRRTALTIAKDASSQGHTLLDIYVDVLQPSLYEIGALWESNTITVAEEHLATAITQYVMGQLFACVDFQDSVNGKAVITGVEGEFHQIGAYMVADVLEFNGWDVRFLGVNVPHKTILQMIEKHEPQIVGISATMIVNVPAVQRLIQDIKSLNPESSLRILIGGSAFRFLPDICQDIGADGFASDLRNLMTLI